MKITKVVYYECNSHSNSGFLSKCSVVFDDSVIVHGIKILVGLKGRYIIMPFKEVGSSLNTHNSGFIEREDIFHPVKKSYSLYMTRVILKGYEEYEKTGNKIYLGGSDGKKEGTDIL